MDVLDVKVIDLFAAEPRIGVLEASRRLGVARGTVQARLDKLATSGVVTGWGPDLDPEALGFPVTAFLTLEIRQGAGHETVAAHLAEIPEVLEAFTITGAGDMWASVVARSNADLQRVIDQVLSHEGIDRSTTVIALATQIPFRMLPLVRSMPAGWARAPLVEEGALAPVRDPVRTGTSPGLVTGLTPLLDRRSRTAAVQPPGAEGQQQHQRRDADAVEQHDAEAVLVDVDEGIGIPVHERPPHQRVDEPAHGHHEERPDVARRDQSARSEDDPAHQAEQRHDDVQQLVGQQVGSVEVEQRTQQEPVHDPAADREHQRVEPQRPEHPSAADRWASAASTADVPATSTLNQIVR